jgi:thiosulfate dehydrogenase [quinone] large subunit
MSLLAGSSPIGPLVRLSLHAGWLTGLAIALAELAVGVGTLLGLRARLAAAGGALLALTFFLTVSWNTSPYYYGADIVFLFAWTPFIMAGAADVLSLDAWLAERARAAVPQTQRVAGPRPMSREELASQRERRVIVTAGAATVLLGGLTAILGRLAGGTRSVAGGPVLTPTTHGPKPPATSRGPSDPKSPQHTPSGVHIGAESAVPVGQAARFTDPATGNPAWMVCLAKGRFAAFSAVCTHAGCTVEYAASNDEFFCPCHGGTFSARTGQVLGGPPPAPLPTIPVKVARGQLYVD